MNARAEHVVTRGSITLEGREVVLENNTWIIGDDRDVVVIDPAHDARVVHQAVGGRTVHAVLLTHGHHDHVASAREYAEISGASTHLHPADLELWSQTHPGHAPDRELADGDRFEAAGIVLTALHTPGHTPGSVCFHAPALTAVFTGDTLFEGGPGATRWPYSSLETIIDSIRTRLFVLGPDTAVHTGHGPSTTIAAEAEGLEGRLARGR